MKWKVQLVNSTTWAICQPPSINSNYSDIYPQQIALDNGLVLYEREHFTTTFPALAQCYLADTLYDTTDYFMQLSEQAPAYVLYIPADFCNIVPVNLMQQHKQHLIIIIEKNASVHVRYTQRDHTSVVAHIASHAQLTFTHQHDSAYQIYSYMEFHQYRESALIFKGTYQNTFHNSYFLLHEQAARVEVTLHLHAQQQQQGWFKTTQVHKAPATQSMLAVKGLLEDEARSTHTGMIHIACDAQQSNAQLQSHYLLIGDKAQAYTQPSLEVLTDNVRCAHGSSIGSFREDQLWYMQARGILLEDCHDLLTKAFFGY